MSKRKTTASAGNAAPIPPKMQKFPPLSAATYRRFERRGQMPLPGFERGDTPPAVKKGAPDDHQA